MVDIVCRVLVEDDGRYLSFKSDAVVFGGGRITSHEKTQIPLSWDAIEEFYATLGGQQIEPSTTTEDANDAIEEIVENVNPVVENTETTEEQKRRTRRTRN